jgi:hypothetical protein
LAGAKIDLRADLKKKDEERNDPVSSRRYILSTVSATTAYM